MAFNSKAFRAQDALLAALLDVPALSDWLIEFGLPARRSDRHIWIDESVDNWTQEAGTTGLISRNEQFQLSVYLYSKRTGSTAAEVRDELATAGEVVTDVVGSAPFLGDVVLYAQVVGGEYAGAFADTEGRILEGYLKLTIACDAFVA